MILEPQITYRDVDPSDSVTAYVADRARKLDTFHPHITSCRVAVEAPHRHHKHGRHYRVRIELTVPGADLIAGGHETDETVREDVYAAVDDAFDEAQRVLRDHRSRDRSARRRS